MCLETFKPELRSILKPLLPLPSSETTKFLGNTAGTLIKLFYAFLWQEGYVTNPIVFNPAFNELGSTLLPLLNKLSCELTSYSYSYPGFYQGEDFYPGQQGCRWNPHSKWHLQGSIGIVDWVFLADEIHRLLSLIQS